MVRASSLGSVPFGCQAKRKWSLPLTAFGQRFERCFSAPSGKVRTTNWPHVKAAASSSSWGSMAAQPELRRCGSRFTSFSTSQAPHLNASKQRTPPNWLSPLRSWRRDAVPAALASLRFIWATARVGECKTDTPFVQQLHLPLHMCHGLDKVYGI